MKKTDGNDLRHASLRLPDLRSASDARDTNARPLAAPMGFALRAQATRRLRRGRISYAAHEYAPLGLHEFWTTICYNCYLVNKGLIYPDECYAIRGAIYEVHNEMGSGFKEELTKEHRAQLLNYLRLTKCKMGLLVNFASYPKATVEQWAL